MLPGLMRDDKKIASLIVATPEKKISEPKDMVGIDAAAEEILSAIETKDKSALVGALKSFIQMCDEEEEMLEGEPETETLEMKE